MRRHPFAIAIALAVSLVAVLPAGASPADDVQIVVPTDLTGAPSPFTASGSAVDGGVVCPSGTVTDYRARVTNASPSGFTFHGIKHFVCDNGSGEFFINLHAQIDFAEGVTFKWDVRNGKGAYVNLQGAGMGVGLDACGADCVLDVYYGGVHLKH